MTSGSCGVVFGEGRGREMFAAGCSGKIGDEAALPVLRDGAWRQRRQD